MANWAAALTLLFAIAPFLLSLVWWPADAHTDPVADALAAQRALGYQPCEPAVLPLYDQDATKLGAADNGVQSGECAVWLKPGLDSETLGWVAWHEACHLSTVQLIWEQPIEGLDDPAHRHPLFRACVQQGPDETGGY